MISPVASGSSKRGRSEVLDIAAVSDVLKHISMAVSSSVKLCRALLISHPTVLVAVALA